MKKTLLALTLVAAAASIGAETFKVPTGTTFRAKADGYDCGTFGPESDYVNATSALVDRNIEFFQLSADKELNQFVIELNYVGVGGTTCTYGAFFTRNRESVRLDLDNSQIVTVGPASDCTATAEWLDQVLTSVPYEASKRGFRYVAVTLPNAGAAEVCASESLRIVFDRR